MSIEWDIEDKILEESFGDCREMDNRELDGDA